MLLIVDIHLGNDNHDLQRGDREEYSYFKFARWWVTADAPLEHFKDKGTWGKEVYLTLDDNAHHDVLIEIGLLSLRLVPGLSAVQAESDHRNNAAVQLAPHVFPQQLMKMWTNKLIENVLDPCREMMVAAWGRSYVNLIEKSTAISSR